MRTTQETKLIPVIEPVDHQAGIIGDSFTMKHAAHALILLSFGAITGDAVLTLKSGATAGAQTTLLPFRHRLSSGDYKAASADLFGAEVLDADGSLTLTAATYDHRMLAIEIPAEDLPEGEPWLTLELSDAASVLLVSAVAVLSQLRYGVDATQI